MPTYEYICDKCGHEFEAHQSIKDGPFLTCPKELCGRKKWGRGRVKRKISTGGGLLFKGTGFYETDYRSEGYKQAEKKDFAPIKSSKPDSKPTASTPATTSSKPAPKAGKK